MLAKSDIPKVTKIMSSSSVSNEDAFDMMARFLESEKTKQKSLDLTGEEYLASSSHAWSELRLACNSLLKTQDDPRAVAPWKFEIGTPTEIPPEESLAGSPESKTEMTATDKDSAKKLKKEAKKAKKEAKKAKKEAKKEAKKRKRESSS
jgi:hypothetical protein